MRDQELTDWGFPGSVAFEDGTVMRSDGKFWEQAYNSGQISLFGLDGKAQFIALNKLIAMVFVVNPHDYKYVVHLDGSRWNCAANNLEWVAKKFRSAHHVLKGKREEIIMLHVAGSGKEKIRKETNATIQYINMVIREFEEQVTAVRKLTE